MELNLKQLNPQEITSTTGTKKMRMAEDMQAIVFQMFTKNIYQNPIGTIVREITSNCKDSHTEAGVNSPIVIRKSFDKVTNTHYISFIDYGVGISPERMENVYGCYFKSTKRVDNTQIGGFGIGGKTPLAYRRSTGFGEVEYDNSYSIITNYNGIKYEYLVYEGPESPEYSEPIMSETTEHNGTEVRVTVLEKDINTFKREMVKQLYYFEDIIFEGLVEDDTYKSDTEEILTNEYQIIKAKTFFFRGDQYDANVHVCLGRVAYPIDYSILGLNEDDYEFPVAIRLEIGEVGVTPSREGLNYSEGTIKLLKKKLEAVKKEITGMLEKQYENIVSLEDYFKVKNEFGELYFPNGNSFNVGEIIKEKDIDFSNFKYAFTKMPNDKQLFRLFFESKEYGKKTRRARWYSADEDGNELTGGYEVLMEKNHHLLYFEGLFERKIVKQAYLKQQHTTYYLINKRNLADVFQMKTISNLFNVSDAIVVTDANGNTSATPFVQSLQEMQEEFFEIVKRQCTDYNSVVVPQDFIDSRKANAKRLSAEFKQITIPVKIFGGYRSTERVKLEALFNLNVPIFYGLKEQDGELRDAQHIFGVLFDSNIIISEYEYNHTFRQAGKKGIMFIRVAANNIKYMQYCKKARPIADFKAKYVYRKADVVKEYFQSQNFINRYKQLPELYRCKEFKNLSSTWATKINKVSKFIEKLDNTIKGKWERDWYKLNEYFSLDNIPLTKEQEDYAAIVTEMEEMIELNRETLEYINVPYRMEYAKEGFWNLMKKILIY